MAADDLSPIDEATFYDPHDGFSGCEMPTHIRDVCDRLVGRQTAGEVVQALLRACSDVGLEAHVKLRRGVVHLSAGEPVTANGVLIGRTYNWRALRYEK